MNVALDKPHSPRSKEHSSVTTRYRNKLRRGSRLVSRPSRFVSRVVGSQVHGIRCAHRTLDMGSADDRAYGCSAWPGPTRLGGPVTAQSAGVAIRTRPTSITGGELTAASVGHLPANVFAPWGHGRRGVFVVDLDHIRGKRGKSSPGSRSAHKLTGSRPGAWLGDQTKPPTWRRRFARRWRPECGLRSGSWAATTRTSVGQLPLGPDFG